MNNLIIQLLIKKLFDKNSNININDIYIPNNVFGVFVTIKSSDKQKLNVFPFNIRGCIGYWDNDFKILEKNVIIEKILDVGYKAFYEDSRNNSFKEADENTIIEVNFLLTPVSKIDDNNLYNNNVIVNNVFDNSIYGLIIKSNINDKKATYLPGVFSSENSKWQDISNSLKNKANIEDDNYEFYYYKTEIISGKLGSISHLEILNNFVKFLNNNYLSFIPYEIKNNNVNENVLQYVRNIASIYDILNIIYDNKKIEKLDNEVFSLIKNNLDYYINLYKNKNEKENLRQASGFLALCLKKINQYKYEMNEIIDNLYNNIDNLEEKFELGEVLMALSILEPHNNILNTKIIFFKNILEEKIKQKIFDTNDIFQLNWIIKFVYEYNSFSYDELELINYIEIILNNIIEKIDNNKETNFLAVTYECLTCLYLYLYKNKKIINSLYKENIKRIYDLLLQRYNKTYFLFMFLDGTMRIDITCHVLNGINYQQKLIFLIENNNTKKNI